MITSLQKKRVLPNALLRGAPFVAGIHVSVLVSETHSLKAEPTNLAMEDGSHASDHVLIQPAEVTVTFSMTNTAGGADRARDALETFRSLLEKREPLELITEHYVYDTMIITSFEPVHQAPNKGAFTASIRLRQINFVSLKQDGRLPSTLASGTVEKTASSKVRSGTQQARYIATNKFIANLKR